MVVRLSCIIRHLKFVSLLIHSIVNSAIGLEESRHRLRAEEARSLKKRADEARLITVDDLTKGIVNYKRLGLDFETTKGENEIRYVMIYLIVPIWNLLLRHFIVLYAVAANSNSKSFVSLSFCHFSNVAAAVPFFSRSAKDGAFLNLIRKILKGNARLSLSLTTKISMLSWIVSRL